MREVTVGLLLRKQFRNFLDEAIFRGELTSYHESKTFFESTFLLKGASTTTVAQINDMVRRVNASSRR